AIAPSFRVVIEALTTNGAALVGLTATPGRGLDKQAENKQLASLFGGKLVTIADESDLVATLQRNGVLARLRRRLIETGIEVHPSGPETESVRLGFDYGASILKVLAKNRH